MSTRSTYQIPRSLGFVGINYVFSMPHPCMDSHRLDDSELRYAPGKEPSTVLGALQGVSCPT